MAEQQPKLLSSGNPQIPKGDGDGPVQQYIAAMPSWKRAVGEELDAMVARLVPEVRKAVRWNTPFYGVEGQGWFFTMYCYKKKVQVGFLNGANLEPMPPKASKSGDVRYLDLFEGDALPDELEDWIRQGAALPGERVF